MLVVDLNSNTDPRDSNHATTSTLLKKIPPCVVCELEWPPKRLATEAEGEEAAYREYDKLMAGRQPIKDDYPVVRLLERFLDHHKAKSAAATFKFYQNALDSFAHYIGDKLRVSDLTPGHVEDWIDHDHRTAKQATPKGTIDTGKPTTDNYRRNLIRAVKAAFRWAEKRNPKCQSPIRWLEMPSPVSRDVDLTPEQLDKLIALAAKSRDGGALLDIITIMTQTGCRPQEAPGWKPVTSTGRAGFGNSLSANPRARKEPRIVHLTDKAFEICQRLALKHPEGAIFRTSAGRPWTRNAFSYRLYCLSEKLGFPVCPYALRHCFATDAITRGVDLQTIATLMGHKDLGMLSKVYQHIKHRGEHLKAGLNKAVGA